MKKALPLLVAVSFVFAGCFGGGGGGGGSSSRPVPPLPNVPNNPVVASPSSAESANISTLETFYTGYLANSVAGAEFGLISLDRAYANIYNTKGVNAATRPGNGVTIGFVDSGLDTEHPAFNGKRMTVEYFGGSSRNSDLADEGDTSHGTSVASIAAGVRADWPDLYVDEDNNPVPATSEGVAPGADIRMFALGSLDSLDAATAAALNPARSVDILNLSLGFPNEEDESYQYGIISDSLYVNVVEAGELSADDFSTEIQAGRTEKTIFVWAAGNENDSVCPAVNGIESCKNGKVDASSPGPLAGLMYLIPELRPHSVAVVAVQLNGTITDFSNRCGVAAQWCIAAPGEEIGVAESIKIADGTISRTIGDFDENKGTSLAAPIVAGGLALMKQQFRGQLSNVELLARMFATATKTGTYAPDTDVNNDNTPDVSSIYGQGLLNVGAATEPVGQASVSSSGGGNLNSEDGWLFSPVSGMRVETGEAFGDGISTAFAEQEIAAFDSLGAPFWYPLEAFAGKYQKPAVGHYLSNFLEFSQSEDTAARADGISVQNGELTASLTAENRAVAGMGEGNGFASGQIPSVSVSLRRGKVENSGHLSKAGHLAFIEDAVSFGVKSGDFGFSAFKSDERGERPVQGAVVSYRLPKLPFGFRSGYISEARSALGTTAKGAFGGFSSETVFTSIGYDYDFGKWEIFANAEMGIAYPETGGGLIKDVSHLATSSFSMGFVHKPSEDSAIRVSVSSPVRVESGRMGLIIPTGRTPGGAILNSALTADIEPSGRQIDIGAQVVKKTAIGNLSLGTVASREPGHNKNADNSIAVLAGYGMNF